MRRSAVLLLAALAAACASSAKVRLDKRASLARRVETVYVAPIANATGNGEAGRIVEAAIRHRLEFAGFRLVQPSLSLGDAMGGGEVRADADLIVRPTLSLALSAVLLAAPPAAAGTELAVVAEAETVTLTRDGAARPAVLGDRLGAGDLLEVGDGGALEVAFRDGSAVEVSPGARVRVGDLAAARISLRLDLGALRASVERSRGRAFEVVTPVATAGVRGTDFGVEVLVGGDRGGGAPPASWGGMAGADVGGDRGGGAPPASWGGMAGADVGGNRGGGAPPASWGGWAGADVEAQIDVFDGEVDVEPPPGGAWQAGRIGAGRSARATLGRRLQMMRMAAARREAWEARRDAFRAAVERRIRAAIEAGRTRAEIYRHLPDEIRERFRDRHEERIRRIRERWQDHRERLLERRQERRERASERRERARENRRDRREHRR